jgi:hypothetical protein
MEGIRSLGLSVDFGRVSRFASVCGICGHTISTHRDPKQNPCRDYHKNQFGNA